MRRDARHSKDPRPAAERRRKIAFRLAFAKLARDDGRLLRLALDNIATWEKAKTCSRVYARKWRRILSLPLEDARAIALADTEEAAALRQNAPFAGFFSEAERSRLRTAARRR